MFFEAGGDQYVAVYDDASFAVSNGQHIPADGLRVTRVGSWCGDGTCDTNESCSTCPDDYDLTQEIPDNGVDDDCDGDSIEPDGGLLPIGPDGAGCSCRAPPRENGPDVITRLLGAR